jgi:hypothetical protein
MVLVLLNTIWTLSSANLLIFVVGPPTKWLVSECLDRVYDYVKLHCEASQTNSISVFLLPGAVNLIARGFYTAEHDIATSRLHLRFRLLLPLCICHTSHAASVQVQKKHMRLGCVSGVRALAFVSCGA